MTEPRDILKWPPVCSKCNEPLEEPGGLVFGYPIEFADGIPTCEKLHVCRKCWPNLAVWFQRGQESDNNDELELRARRALDGWVLAGPPAYKGPRVIRVFQELVQAWSTLGHECEFSAESHVELARKMGLI